MLVSGGGVCVCGGISIGMLVSGGGGGVCVCGGISIGMLVSGGLCVCGGIAGLVFFDVGCGTGSQPCTKLCGSGNEMVKV